MASSWCGIRRGSSPARSSDEMRRRKRSLEGIRGVAEMKVPARSTGEPSFLAYVVKVEDGFEQDAG
jgi:hypothetical protein